MVVYDDLYEGYVMYIGLGYLGGVFLLDFIFFDMEIIVINFVDFNYGGVKVVFVGFYLEVEGLKGKIIVYVIDLYFEGVWGVFDLLFNVFWKIGDMKDGKINIKWCVVKVLIIGNFMYWVKEGSSRWWVVI